MACCAIASAAKYNPRFPVKVYTLNPEGLVRDRDKCFQGHANIGIERYTFEELFEDTPFQDWHTKLMADHAIAEDLGNWKGKDTWYTAQNLANAARVAVLYKMGGYYFDLDMISVDTMEGAAPRAVGMQSGHIGQTLRSRGLNNAALLFASAKDPLLKLYIDEFVASFDNCKWGHNGPDRMTATLLKYGCYASASASASRPHSACTDFTVYPKNVFYAAGWSDKELFFWEGALDEDWEDWKASRASKPVPKWHSRGVHLWARMWKERIARTTRDSSSIFARMMRESCGAGWQDAAE